MFDQFNEVHVSPEQGEVIARGLYALSRVDGHEAREGMLIKALWLDTMAASRGVDLKALEMASDISVEELAKQLHNNELRVVFMLSAVMLTYADGNVSQPEKDWLARCAKAFKMSDEDLKAVYAYLRSIPAVHNRVPDPLPPAGAPTPTN